ncbi:MAG: hypothetical protein ACTHKG_06780 [Nocardioides sp.]
MNTYEWLTACAGILTAIATTLLALFAFTAFRASVAQLKLLSADSARQTRPYVNLDLAPGLHGNGFWDITIENVGRSIARNVRIDAGPLKARDADDHISDRLAEFFARPLTLPPGARRRVMWRMEPDGRRTTAGASTDVEVLVTYSDDERTEYSDTFNVATEGYGPVAPSPSTGPTVSGCSRTKGEESLANIERALQTLNTHVGMLRH